MGCFIVPAVAGVITTVCRKQIPEKYHIKWFNTMVWGAVAALLVEHIWHGEITAAFPFLTAAAEPGVLFTEMLTVGVPMLLAVTAVWAGMVFVYNRFIAPAADSAGITA